MSGEVYAAAKASTCCDAVGEEYPNGAPRKIAAGNFVGSPEGGGTTFPARRTPVFTFEPDESRRKRVSNTPMLFACIRAFLS